MIIVLHVSVTDAQGKRRLIGDHAEPVGSAGVARFLVVKPRGRLDIAGSSKTLVSY
jgi:hypothetical protein